jgi:4-hydroxy-tetrahydrodipicolinate synthase
MLVDEGEVVVCVTCFDDDGKFDLDLVERHLRSVMAHARTVLVGGSGTEEGFALTGEERSELIRIAVALGKETGTSVRLNALEPRTAGQLIADVQLALEAGIDAIHVPILDVGHGYRPTPEELLAYGRTAIADTGGLPVYISSSQVMGHVFPIPVLAAFAEYPHVRGMVVGAPSDQYLGDVLGQFAGRWNVHMAGTSHLLNGIALGARGFVSPEGNLAPQVSRAVANAMRTGDGPAIIAGAEALLRITGAIRRFGLPAGIKAVLRARDNLLAHVRPPRIDASDEQALVAAQTVASAVDRWQSSRAV